MTTGKTISEIMKCEFGMAKKWLRYGIVCQWLLVVIAIFSIATNAVSNIFVVSITFLGPLSVLLFREIGNHYYQKGEKIRRLYLLQQSLGVEPTEADLLNLYACATNSKNNEPDPVGGYYSSHYSGGFSKLLHNLQESAFWTEHQAKLTMFIHYFLAGVGILASSYIAFFWLYKGGEYANADHAKLFATLLLFFVAQTELPIARSFQSLSKIAGEVVSKASLLHKKTDIDCVDVIKIISTYDSALAKALPLPGYSYKLLQKKLNKAWDDVRPTMSV